MSAMHRSQRSLLNHIPCRFFQHFISLYALLLCVLFSLSRIVFSISFLLEFLLAQNISIPLMYSYHGQTWPQYSRGVAVDGECVFFNYSIASSRSILSALFDCVYIWLFRRVSVVVNSSCHTILRMVMQPYKMCEQSVSLSVFRSPSLIRPYLPIHIVEVSPWCSTHQFIVCFAFL